MATTIFCKIDRSQRNMEIYKCKWMVLGALGCINNADFEEKSKWQHCARCVYYLSEITTRTSNLKIILYSYVLIDLQSNPSKHPKSAESVVEWIEYRRLHHVWMLTFHVLVESHPFCTSLDLQLSFYHPLCNDSKAHCPVLQCYYY